MSFLDRSDVRYAPDLIHVHVRSIDLYSLGKKPGAQYAELCQAALCIWEAFVTVMSSKTGDLKAVQQSSTSDVWVKAEGSDSHIHKHHARRAEIGDCVSARNYSGTVIH